MMGDDTKLYLYMFGCAVLSAVVLIFGTRTDTGVKDRIELARIQLAITQYQGGGSK